MKTIFFICILLTTHASAASWLLGAGLSPYHFELEQKGDIGKANYSSNVLNSYRFIVQKSIKGWIWNNEMTLSFLNFSGGESKTVPLYEFHTGVQRKGFIAGLEATKNLFVDNSGDEAKPLDQRSLWLAAGYRFTPKKGNWRVLGKVSVPFSSKVSGDTTKSQSGYRILIAPELLGPFKGKFLNGFSWSGGPYYDFKEWDIKLKESGHNRLRFQEYGLIFNINKIF